LSSLFDRLVVVVEVPNPSPLLLPRFFLVFFADSIVEAYLCCAEGIFIDDGDENALQHDTPTTNRSIDRRSIDDIIIGLFVVDLL